MTDPRLGRLIAKAHAGQWTIDRIAWDLEPVLPAQLPRAIYLDMVSQLYHAERAALDVLARLDAELPASDATARRFIATQLADEQRHAAVYRRYLARLGDLVPINPALDSIFRAAGSAQLPAFALVAALNIVMEHEALAQQQRRIDTLPCPLFGQINRAIVADESRHAGFGVIYLDGALREASRDDRLRVAAWIAELWEMWCDANTGRYANTGEEVLRIERAELDVRWTLLVDRLARLGLATRDELAELS